VWEALFQRLYPVLLSRECLDYTFVQARVTFKRCLDALMHSRIAIIHNSRNFGGVSYETLTAECFVNCGFPLRNIDTLNLKDSKFGPERLLDLLARSDIVLNFSNGAYGACEGLLPRWPPASWQSILGDCLKDFVDTGKPVLNAVFSVCSGAESLGGAWWNDDLNPIKTSALENSFFQTNTEAQLGIVDLQHLCFQGIRQLAVKYRAIGEVHSRGLVLGRFNDDKPLLVALQHKPIIGINLFPPPRLHEPKRVDGGWSGDGDRLMANCLLFLLIGSKLGK